MTKSHISPPGAATVPTDRERSDMTKGRSNSNQVKNPQLESRVHNKNQAVVGVVLAVARLLSHT